MIPILFGQRKLICLFCEMTPLAGCAQLSKQKLSVTESPSVLRC